MSKNFLYLLVLQLVLFSCANDDLNDLNNEEYVLLFPESLPLNTLEYNNELYVFYDSRSDYLQFSKLDHKGNVVWNKDLLWQTYPDNSIVILSGSKINFYYEYMAEFRRLVLDLDGNILSNDLIYTSSFQYIQKFDSGFYRIRCFEEAIDIETYSLTGELLLTRTIDAHIESPSPKVIIKGNKIYLFSTSNFNSDFPSYYEYFRCDVFVQNRLVNTINIPTLEKYPAEHSGLVFNDGTILMPFTYEDNTGFLNYEWRIFDPVTGKEVKNKKFEASSNISAAMINTDGNIVFAGGNPRLNDKTKWSQFTILDTDLNQLSQRIIGSYDRGELFFEIKETQNYYYISGTTFGSDGDFDLPNNSPAVDMFIYRLNK